MYIICLLEITDEIFCTIFNSCSKYFTFFETLGQYTLLFGNMEN